MPLDSIEFFERFTAAVSEAGVGDMVSVAAMSFEPREPITHGVVCALAQAALQGADVNVALDDYTFMFPRSAGPLALPWISDRAGMASRLGAVNTLAGAGVRVRSINQKPAPMALMFQGRSHLKIYALNEQVYIGGPNLHYTERLDAVADVQDPVAASLLHDIVGRLVETGSTVDTLLGNDSRYTLSGDAELLLDAGVPGQSIIMEEALTMIDEATESIAITSQYFFQGETARHLQRAADRGVMVHAPCAHPSGHGRVAGLAFAAMRFAQQLSSGGTSLAGHQLPKEWPKLHTKALVTEKAAILGSHNFDPTGVSVGTTEIALLSHDPYFVAALSGLISRQTVPIKV